MTVPRELEESISLMINEMQYNYHDMLIMLHAAIVLVQLTKRYWRATATVLKRRK